MGTSGRVEEGRGTGVGGICAVGTAEAGAEAHAGTIRSARYTTKVFMAAIDFFRLREGEAMRIVQMAASNFF
jgi:hypothetical protein